MQNHLDTWVPTQSVVAGDVIRFTEAVFSGSFRSPKCIGEHEVTAMVASESYGEKRQQHTFTLTVLGSTGVNPLATGATVLRKGRNIYRNGVERQLWVDEAVRDRIEAEKHARGDAAREVRNECRQQDIESGIIRAMRRRR